MKSITPNIEGCKVDRNTPAIIRWAIQKVEDVPYWGLKEFIQDVPDFDLDVIFHLAMELEDFQASADSPKEALRVHHNTAALLSTLTLILAASDGFMAYGETDDDCMLMFAEMTEYTKDLINLEKFKRANEISFDYASVSYENFQLDYPYGIEIQEISSDKTV